MIVSVPTMAGGLVTVLGLSATIGALALPGFGRSHGSAIQSQYVLASTNPMATTRKRLNSEDRVKIAQPIKRKTFILLSPNFCVKLIAIREKYGQKFLFCHFRGFAQIKLSKPLHSSTQSHPILSLGLAGFGCAPL
jgi:hypothetical protein